MIEWFNLKVIKIKKVKISSDLIKYYESRIIKEKFFYFISNIEFCVEFDKGCCFKYYNFFL